MTSVFEVSQIPVLHLFSLWSQIFSIFDKNAPSMMLRFRNLSKTARATGFVIGPVR